MKPISTEEIDPKRKSTGISDRSRFRFSDSRQSRFSTDSGNLPSLSLLNEKTMKYQFFTAQEITPTGWLKKQLELQASGLCGSLDKVWPDIRDSAWIGGDREGWERVPYWLDGFIPLAFLLRNEDMIARAKRFIDRILSFQQADGWICPNGSTPREAYDTWAVQLIAKVLTVWYDCSGDDRIPQALYRLLKNYHDLLGTGKIRLFGWGKSRWYETFIALHFLNRFYPDEPWIPSLARILKEQGTDWAALTDRWKAPLNEWTQETHIVNLVMMLKAEAVSHGLLKEDYADTAERLYQILRKYNGTPVGVFTGDECLSGLSPIQGTELCSVVELMYTMEWLYAETGDAKWAERLETVAFNALPASVSEDMWSHQYVQMSNQIDCTEIVGNPPFGTNTGEAHVFGLEPHYGCCTANHGQGWPKLALSAFMQTADGIVSAIPLPTKLETVRNGIPVTVECVTEYPFRNQIVYRVTVPKKTDFVLHLRIPSFAKHPTCNGKPIVPGQNTVISGFSDGTTEIAVSFETEPELHAWANDLFYAKCGSLVFSLPIAEQWERKEYRKQGVERKYPYCDYRLKGKSGWNFAYDTGNSFEKHLHQGNEIPFSATHPRITLSAQLCPIDWGYEPRFSTVCRKTPGSTIPTGDPENIELIPYGCAKLRMTELPIVKKGANID